jgi:hypothetical protein
MDLGRKGRASRPEKLSGAPEEQTHSFPQKSTVTLPSQHYEMVLASDWERIKESIREMPEPSTHWLALALAMLGIAAGAAIAAMTVSKNAAVSSGLLWVGSVALIIMSLLCGFFHWSSNREVRRRREEIIKDMDRSVSDHHGFQED